MIAQLDPETLDAVKKIIPSGWVPYVLFAVLCIPYATRAWKSIRSSGSSFFDTVTSKGGLCGIWNAVMHGTNVSPVVLQKIEDNAQAIQQVAAATGTTIPPSATVDKPVNRDSVPQ
jgi:hypothetical protein